jgi:hypothetical protein
MLLTLVRFDRFSIRSRKLGLVSVPIGDKSLPPTVIGRSDDLRRTRLEVPIRHGGERRRHIRRDDARPVEDGQDPAPHPTWFCDPTRAPSRSIGTFFRALG